MNGVSRARGCSSWGICLSWLPYPLTSQSSDISCCNAFTHVAMQNLDNRIGKSKNSISTKLTLYNTCILLIFLYGSEYWAVTKRDAHKIDALDEWCLWKLLGISDTTMYGMMMWDGQLSNHTHPHLSAIFQAWCFSLFGHIAWMPDETDAKRS